MATWRLRVSLHQRSIGRAGETQGERSMKCIYDQHMPMAWIQDFSPNKPRTVTFTSGDDPKPKSQ